MQNYVKSDLKSAMIFFQREVFMKESQTKNEKSGALAAFHSRWFLVFLVFTIY
jgi:hypothetical protein